MNKTLPLIVAICLSNLTYPNSHYLWLYLNPSLITGSNHKDLQPILYILNILRNTSHIKEKEDTKAIKYFHEKLCEICVEKFSGNNKNATQMSLSAKLLKNNENIEEFIKNHLLLHDGFHILNIKQITDKGMIHNCPLKITTYAEVTLRYIQPSAEAGDTTTYSTDYATTHVQDIRKTNLYLNPAKENKLTRKRQRLGAKFNPR